jgi:hypothetical protein
MRLRASERARRDWRMLRLHAPRPAARYLTGIKPTSAKA